MLFEPTFDIYALLILLGVFQGFFVSFFLLQKKNRTYKRNIYLGFFILALSLVIFEILLNYTGLITRVMYLDNFAEPLNFVLAPLFYFYVYFGLYPEQKPKVGPHFVFFFLYLLYCFFYFAQPEAAKYNSYLFCYHPELPMAEFQYSFSPDPLGIRRYVNELILIQIAFYLALAGRLLFVEYQKRGLKVWSFKNENIQVYRNFTFHFLVIALIVIFVKVKFGRDIGDYFIASYCAFLLYLTSFSIIKRSSFFNETLYETNAKYLKSSLSDQQKDEILDKLVTLMTRDHYFRSNLASLSDTADRVNESHHRVSQVINEKTGLNFYAWLATYRIEEARNVLSGPDAMKLKIEEVAEMVGYNSKASFNKVFKSLTGQTPSEYRNAAREKS